MRSGLRHSRSRVAPFGLLRTGVHHTLWSGGNKLGAGGQNEDNRATEPLSPSQRALLQASQSINILRTRVPARSREYVFAHMHSDVAYATGNMGAVIPVGCFIIKK